MIKQIDNEYVTLEIFITIIGITTRTRGSVRVTPEMTISEAIYGRISTRNTQRRKKPLSVRAGFDFERCSFIFRI
jgi:hypothetical protein